MSSDVAVRQCTYRTIRAREIVANVRGSVVVVREIFYRIYCALNTHNKKRNNKQKALHNNIGDQNVQKPLTIKSKKNEAERRTEHGYDIEREILNWKLGDDERNMHELHCVTPKKSTQNRCNHTSIRSHSPKRNPYHTSALPCFPIPLSFPIHPSTHLHIPLPGALKKESNNKNLQPRHRNHKCALHQTEIENPLLRTPNRAKISVLARAEVLLITADGGQLGRKLKDGFFEDGGLFGVCALFRGELSVAGFVFDLDIPDISAFILIVCNRGVGSTHSNLKIHHLLRKSAHLVIEAEPILAGHSRRKHEVALSFFGTVQYNLLVRADDRVVDVEGAAGLDSEVKSNLRSLFPRVGEEARPLMSLQFIRQRRGIYSTRKASPEAGKEDEGPHRVASCRPRIDWGRFVDVQQFGDGKVQLSITNRHGRMMLHKYLGAAGMRPRTRVGSDARSTCLSISEVGYK
jgi:hypothetical protein